MPRKSKRDRTASEEHPTESSTRAQKRVKEATSEQNLCLLQDINMNANHAQVQKKPNRLQRAVAKQLETKNTMTMAQARKIKRAEKQTGTLVALLDAPVEIFCEVARYFSPLDLLNLSRVSRQLRDFLLSKINKSIWVLSLKSLDLPPCPEDLNEPQYASLVFDSYCNACGIPSVKSVHYELRVRLCKNCFELNVVSAMKFIYLPRVNSESEYADDISTRAHYILEYFYALDPIIPCYTADPTMFYEPDLADALEKCISISDTSHEFDTFLEESRRRKTHILMHAESMKGWEEAKKEERRSELLDLAGEHEKCVKAKLFALGYEEEDWTFYVFSGQFADNKLWNKLIRQKRELTARTWKNLQPKLEEFLTYRRRKIRYTKRRNELKQVYIDYIGKLNLAFGEVELLLPLNELFKKQAVEELLVQDDSRRIITDEVWSSFIPTVEQLREEYRSEIIAKHEASIIAWQKANEKELTSFGDSPRITLAASFFRHRLSQNLYYFNSAHSVVTHLTATLTRGAIIERPFLDGLYEFYVSNANCAIPIALLEALELPLSTSMAFIQAMGRCFVCCRCDAAIQKPMGWTELVKHYFDEAILYSRWSFMFEAHRHPEIDYLEDHSIRGGGLVRKLNNEEMVLASQGESTMPSAAGGLKCALCCQVGVPQNSGMSLIYVEAHIRSKHGRAASPTDIFEAVNWTIFNMGVEDNLDVI